MSEFRSTMKPTFGACLIIVASLLSAQAVTCETMNKAEAIGIAASQKSKAEGLAGMLYDGYVNHEVNAAEHKRGRLLYNEAKAKFDGWLERLQFELQQGTNMDAASSASYQNALGEAVNKSDEFTKYATGVLLGENRGIGLGPASVVDMLNLLKDAGLAIWKEYRDGSQERKEKVLLRIESLKWKPIQQIEKEATKAKGTESD